MLKTFYFLLLGFCCFSLSGQTKSKHVDHLETSTHSSTTQNHEGQTQLAKDDSSIKGVKAVSSSEIKAIKNNVLQSKLEKSKSRLYSITKHGSNTTKYGKIRTEVIRKKLKEQLALGQIDQAGFLAKNNRLNALNKELDVLEGLINKSKSW